MRSRRTLLLIAGAALATLLGGCAAPQAPDHAVLTQQVADTERAFAKTMADRDAKAFATFIAEETVFFNAKGPVRGKAAVVADWQRFFVGPEAPFAWAPQDVEVLPSGTLALTSGPVYAPDGKVVASFTSIWRLEAPGVWRIVFDKGCDCPP